MISSFVFPQECLIQCAGWTVLGMNQHNPVKESVVCKTHLSFVEEVGICVSNELGCQEKKGWSCSWGNCMLPWRMSFCHSLCQKDPVRYCFGRENAKHLISWEIWGHGSTFCTTDMKQSVESSDYYSFLHFRENVMCNHIKSCFSREFYKCILCFQYTIFYTYYSYLMYQ